MNISVIHVHGQRANYFVWLMRRLFPRSWGGLPLVATVHGWVQDNFLRRAVTRLEWGTLRDCDHIITVSELQKRTLTGMGFDPRKVSVVRPGIVQTPSPSDDAETTRLRREARERRGIAPDAYVISAIGRLSTEKRFDLYLQVCAKLASALPGATFMLVGGGKQEASLRALASSLGLDGRVIFTGLTREMPAVYAATDLVMITSDTEGIPHVLLEALSRGIPVVSTAVGGIPEVVKDGESGLLVPSGDVEALANAAKRVCEDPALTQRLSAGGRALATGFTIDSLAEGMEEVYRQVLTGKPYSRGALKKAS
jgi:glycosyltransferase involved in cell wall biosynthesis